MPYISRFERRCIERGVEQGVEKGRLETLRNDILEILEVRFHSVSFSIKKQISQISDEAVLRKLLREAITAESPDSFNEILP